MGLKELCQTAPNSAFPVVQREGRATLVTEDNGHNKWSASWGVKGKDNMREVIVKVLMNLTSVLPPYLCGCAWKFDLLCLYNRRNNLKIKICQSQKERGKKRRKCCGVTTSVFFSKNLRNPRGSIWVQIFPSKSCWFFATFWDSSKTENWGYVYDNHQLYRMKLRNVTFAANVPGS